MTKHFELSKEELSQEFHSLDREAALKEAIDRANYYFKQINGDYSIPECQPQIKQVLSLVLAAGLLPEEPTQ